MPLIGANGGLVGVQRTSGGGQARGVWVPNEQVLFRRQDKWIGDSDFSSISLLLHMDGSNGSTTFTDSGPKATSVTANGGVSVSTAQFKYGGASAFFNGTTDSLSFADPALGTGSFTIEFWFKTASSVQYAQFIGNEGPGYSLLINNSSSTAGDIALYNGSLLCATSGTDYGDDAWHHLALTRSGTSITIWIDGASKATATSGASFSGQTNYIGRNNAYSPRNLVGYIDELRITKGVARYTGAFTPPAESFANA